MALEATLNIVPMVARVNDRSESEQARLRKAFDQNYAGVWRYLRRVGVPSDRVDDAAQQVFLIALEALGRIQHGSERMFLYATAIRVAYGIRRKLKREVPTMTMDFNASPLPRPDQLADQKRAREVVEAILLEIDIDQRNVFVLSEFEGFTTPEIAQLLELPLGTAASRLRRARERFQGLVRKVYGDDR